MRKYATEHTSTLLRRLAYHMNRVGRSADSDSVHDLRVAIRRFTQSLRVFAPFFPSPRQNESGGAWAKSWMRLEKYATAT